MPASEPPESTCKTRAGVTSALLPAYCTQAVPFLTMTGPRARLTAVAAFLRVLTGTFRVLRTQLTGGHAKVAVEAGIVSISAGSGRHGGQSPFRPVPSG